MYEYKLKGHGKPFTYIFYTGLGALDNDYTNNLFKIMKKYDLRAEDINLMPHCHAIDFDDSEGEFVFIVYATQELDSSFLDFLQLTLHGKGLSDRNGNPDIGGHFWIVCPNAAVEIKRVKKVLVPFL